MVGGQEGSGGSVHWHLLGGQVFRLTGQSVGAGIGRVLVVGVGGGCWWTHLGLKQEGTRVREEATEVQMISVNAKTHSPVF